MADYTPQIRICDADGEVVGDTHTPLSLTIDLSATGLKDSVITNLDGVIDFDTGYRLGVSVIDNTVSPTITHGFGRFEIRQSDICLLYTSPSPRD